jgi:hypothetical protein
MDPEAKPEDPHERAWLPDTQHRFVTAEGQRCFIAGWQDHDGTVRIDPTVHGR